MTASVFLRRAAICLGLGAATVGGCSGTWADESRPPDYDRLQTELREVVAAVDGWTATDDSDAEYRRHVERWLRGRMLVSRTCASEATGTEVRLTIVAGPRKRLRLFSPLGSSCMSPVRDVKTIAVSGPETSFEFQSCRRLERVRGGEHRHLWAHTLNGEWTADFLLPRSSFLPGDAHEVGVFFSTPMSTGYESGELSDEVRRLVAVAMGRISPILLADGTGFGEPTADGD